MGKRLSVISGHRHPDFGTSIGRGFVAFIDPRDKDSAFRIHDNGLKRAADRLLRCIRIDVDRRFERLATI